MKNRASVDNRQLQQAVEEEEWNPMGVDISTLLPHVDISTHTQHSTAVSFDIGNQLSAAAAAALSLLFVDSLLLFFQSARIQ